MAKHDAAGVRDVERFVEQFFPLVRAINQKLPPGKRLRVLAGDPPIDWDQVKSFQDFVKFARRDDTVAAVMEKEVLSKHRKALMLFGLFHMMHGTRTAVSIDEKHYPNVTFIITELGNLGANAPANAQNPFAAWPVPSLARGKGTWLGALELDHFFTPMTTIHEEDCSHAQFPPDLQKPMAELVDAFLYLGPQDLRLMEPMPADIALDMDDRMELQRRDIPLGAPGVSPEALKEADQEILKGAGDPLYPKPDPKSADAQGQDPELEEAVQNCLKRKN